MKFHDAHCHLSSKSFLKTFDIGVSLKRWVEDGLEYVIGVSTKLSESKKIVDMHKVYKTIIPGIGIHPWSAKSNLSENIKNEFRDIIQNNKLLVIGEIGLDYHFIKIEERYEYQYETFTFFLDIAEKLKLPINVHLKGAEKRGEEILSSYNLSPDNVLIHWYSGPEKIMKKFIDSGYFFSVNPSILTGSKHINVLQSVSYDRILTESDGDVSYKIEGKRIVGSPSIIPETLKKVCEIKNETLEEVSIQLQKNLRNYMNLN